MPIQNQNYKIDGYQETQIVTLDNFYYDLNNGRYLISQDDYEDFVEYCVDLAYQRLDDAVPNASSYVPRLAIEKYVEESINESPVVQIENEEYFFVELP